MLHAGLKTDHLIITCKGDDRLPLEVRTKEDFFDKFVPIFEEYGGIVCSSALDWPEDVTKDSDLILMCDLIRGNNVSGRNPDYQEQA